MTNEELAQYIDHTLLRPDATEAMIRKLCDEAQRYNFYSVCVNGRWVSLASNILENSDIKVCAVAGFPLGASTSEVKSFEAEQCVDDGADEIDMVIAIGALKEQRWDYVQADIEEVVEAIEGLPLKVILETGLLTREEIETSCRIVVESGAQFVKTCTGFVQDSEATLENISLMRKSVGPRFGVKASGGIRDRKTAEAMIQAGANRLGTSQSVTIITGESGAKSGY